MGGKKRDGCGALEREEGTSGKRERAREKEREKERGREREADTGSEEEWKEKNQANWYAAHNNRRVERRGSEVRPARGSCSWREGGINTLSFSRLLFHLPARTRESERVDTRERVHARASLRRCSRVSLIFLPSFFIGRRLSPRSSP